MSFARRPRHEAHWVRNHTSTPSVPLVNSTPRQHPANSRERNDILSCEHQTDKLSARTDATVISTAIRCIPQSSQNWWNIVTHACSGIALPEDWIHPHAWADSAIAQSLACEWALIVLHDLPTGAMDHLDEFIVRLRKNDFELRQDFPDDCVPIRKGHIISALDRYLPNRFQDRS